MPTSRPRRLRASRACDYCHGRRIKCWPCQEDPDRCQNCVDFDLVCQYDRPQRRGRPPTTPLAPRPQLATRPLNVSRSRRRSTSSPSPEGAKKDSTAPQSVGRAWRAFARASGSYVGPILNVYFETVYPIFPLFDGETVKAQVAKGEHITNNAIFCSVMAACALAAARVRDGALIMPQGRRPDLLGIHPEDYFAAAEDALPSNLLEVHGFNYLRGCALLALASIQEGRVDCMRKYLGHYFTVMAVRQWHDEVNWPAGLSPVEKEERRRLYWSIYTLDIFSAIVWNGPFHFQEAHSRVEYPRGTTSSQSSDTDWILGWNFTTDLYRILEHAVTRLRTRHSRFNFFTDGTTSGTVSNSAILQKVDSLYSALPPSFKELRPATGNLDTDIYGFQAANIQATLALLRMVFMSLEGDADLEKKCAVAADVLETFHHVPRAFQRAISTPLIYHIASIGNFLGSVMEGPLSEVSYQRVRGVLVSMASLLESLEDFLSRRAGAGRSLRELVGRIDRYMESRRGMGREGQAPVRMEGPAGPEGLELSGIEAGGIGEFSDLFQIPDELLQDWNWPSMLLSDVQNPLV